MNTGVRAARFPIICQVDQDVVISPTGCGVLAAEFDDPAVGAAQGITRASAMRRCARGR